MYFQVLRSGEDFPARGKRAWERFLTGVNPDVIDEFVLGLEGSSVSGATLPEARVRRALRSAHVFDGQMGDDVVERIEEFAAQLSSCWSGTVLVEPHARHLLSLGAAPGSHVPEESAVGMMTRMTDGRVLLVVYGRRCQVGCPQILMMRW